MILTCVGRLGGTAGPMKVSEGGGGMMGIVGQPRKSSRIQLHENSAKLSFAIIYDIIMKILIINFYSSVSNTRRHSMRHNI